VCIGADEQPADEVFLGMDWFVEGIVGTIPKYANRSRTKPLRHPFMTAIYVLADSVAGVRGRGWPPAG
jgi:hypothetical protein